MSRIPGIYGYIIYHPFTKRANSEINGVTIYYDEPSHNQDPYIWNINFLHSTCHMTQMTPQISDINFWVGDSNWPEFQHLYCDLVFEVEKKCDWPQLNNIDPTHKIVDSVEAYNDHYYWVPIDHKYKENAGRGQKKRFTLKASRNGSYQPQTEDRQLIDILPFLLKNGYGIKELHKGLRAGAGAKPLPITNMELLLGLIRYIEERASIKLKGDVLQVIRAKNPNKLASPRDI